MPKLRQFWMPELSHFRFPQAHSLYSHVPERPLASHQRYFTAIDVLLLTFVASAAVTFAVVLFAQYYSYPETLWRGEGSDRSAHFGLALRLAIAVQTLDIGWFLEELRWSLLRPPLHGIVLAVVLLVGGLDPRLGTIPSLIGWVGTIVLTWLIARRLFADRLLGIVCATVAATFAMASPTFRLISNDVMLEGLGAALTALAVWLFPLACAAPESAPRWRWLALTLTALFYYKGNYWGLTTASLAVAYLVQNPRRWADLARETLASLRWPATGTWLLRQPLLLVAILMAGVTVLTYVQGPGAIEILGFRITYGPNGLTHQTYVVLFIWATIVWYRHRKRINAGLGVAGQAILYWHIVPSAASFLLPWRLYWFIWYIGPMNNFGGRFDPIEAATIYWSALVDGFHVAPSAAVCALSLAAIAIANIRRFDAQHRAPFILVIVGAAAVILHPSHQGRFMASWIFALWISAGAGMALVLGLAMAKLSDRSRTALAAAAVLLVAAANVLQKPSPAAALYAIQKPGQGELELSRIYTPHLSGTHWIGVFPTHWYRIWILQWVAPLQCRCHVIIETLQNLEGVSRDEFHDNVGNWLAVTKADRLIAISTPEGGVSPEWVRDVMTNNDRFELIVDSTVTGEQGTVMVWQRKNTWR